MRPKDEIGYCSPGLPMHKVARWGANRSLRTLSIRSCPKGGLRCSMRIGWDLRQSQLSLESTYHHPTKSADRDQTVAGLLRAPAEPCRRACCGTCPNRGVHVSGFSCILCRQLGKLIQTQQRVAVGQGDTLQPVGSRPARADMAVRVTTTPHASGHRSALEVDATARGRTPRPSSVIWSDSLQRFAWKSCKAFRLPPTGRRLQLWVALSRDRALISRTSAATIRRCRTDAAAYRPCLNARYGCSGQPLLMAVNEPSAIAICRSEGVLNTACDCRLRMSVLVCEALLSPAQSQRGSQRFVILGPLLLKLPGQIAYECVRIIDEGDEKSGAVGKLN